MGSVPDPTEERRIPSGIHSAVHQEEELYPQRQRRSRHGNLPKRGQGSRPPQEDVKEAAKDDEGTLQHGRPIRQPRRRNDRMTSTRPITSRAHVAITIAIYAAALSPPKIWSFARSKS